MGTPGGTARKAPAPQGLWECSFFTVVSVSSTYRERAGGGGAGVDEEEAHMRALKPAE